MNRIAPRLSFVLAAALWMPSCFSPQSNSPGTDSSADDDDSEESGSSGNSDDDDDDDDQEEGSGDASTTGTSSTTTDSSTSSSSSSSTSSSATGNPTSTGDTISESGTESGPAEELEWLPSWATSIQRTEERNLPPPLNNNTLRQFVWPTVSGSEIRIQLSNEKGSSPVDIQRVHVAMAMTGGNPGDSGGQIDPTTDAAFTFGGAPNVTIPAGQTVWSDALSFPLEEIRLTAVTMQLGSAVPNEITGHPGARTTSYIANGDAVSQQSLSGETRERWYFINAIEVMAPHDAYAVAVLGDSITDGYGIINQFARWPDFLTLRIQGDPQISDNRSVLNFGMGANSLTTTDGYQDAGVDRFVRDVLTRDKIKWLIVLEGVNDMSGGVQAQPLISAYQQIITQAHAQGILVYGSPVTPYSGSGAVRDQVNTWIRTSGEFDAVIPLDEAIADPSNPNAIASMYDNDGLHPNAAGYEAMAEAVDLSLFYDVQQ